MVGMEPRLLACHSKVSNTRDLWICFVGHISLQKLKVGNVGITFSLLWPLLHIYQLFIYLFMSQLDLTLGNKLSMNGHTTYMYILMLTWWFDTQQSPVVFFHGETTKSEEIVREVALKANKFFISKIGRVECDFKSERHTGSVDRPQYKSCVIQFMGVQQLRHLAYGGWNVWYEKPRV